MGPTHVMVDLETFGSRPGSVIASIGAVAFDPVTGEMGATFTSVVDPASCTALGLTMDADTVIWWLKQGESARAALTNGGGALLPDALRAFNLYWKLVGGTHFWGHGGNFDDPMLAAAYHAAGLTPPWRYSASRCTRTIFDLAGVSPDRAEGVHHTALDDARAQALAVIAAYRKLVFLPVEAMTGTAK